MLYIIYLFIDRFIVVFTYFSEKRKKKKTHTFTVLVFLCEGEEIFSRKRGKGPDPASIGPSDNLEDALEHAHSIFIYSNIISFRSIFIHSFLHIYRRLKYSFYSDYSFKYFLEIAEHSNFVQLILKSFYF